MKKSKQPSHRSDFRLAIALALLIFLVYAFGLIVFRLIDAGHAKAKPSVVQLASQIVSKKNSRTLVLLLNSSEARIGGGFIGSVTTVQNDNGKLHVDPVQSIYYFDDLGVARYNADIAAGRKPSVGEPYLRDTNQNVEWSTNAKVAADRYEYATGKHVDSVIALTPDVLKNMLVYTGPIKLDDYGKTLTADNFLEQVELEVESGVDKQAGTEPKSILGEAASVVVSKLWNKNILQLSGLYGLAQKLTDQKDIVLWSRDESTQQKIATAKLGGLVNSGPYDYFFIAEQNGIANKSTPYIQQTVSKKIKIDNDGSAVVDVTINRQHTSDYAHEFTNPWGNFKMYLIGENKSFMKLVLPPQSQVSNADFPVQHDVEGKLDYYDFYSDLVPLSQETYHFSYQLPFKYSVADSLDVISEVQKQIGRAPYQFNLQVELPSSYGLVGANTKDISYSRENNDLVTNYTTSIDTDKIISLRYAKSQ